MVRRKGYIRKHAALWLGVDSDVRFNSDDEPVEVETTTHKLVTRRRR